MNDNMKTTFLLISICVASFCYAQSPYSKQNKIAVFDIDLMVQALPEYAVVDSLVKIYEQDTLNPEYELLQNQYKQIEAYYLRDINIDYADIKPIDSIGQRRTELAMKLIYWQSYAHQKDSIKKRTLADPLYQRVRTAFCKVISNKNYDVIVKTIDYLIKEKAIDHLLRFLDDPNMSVREWAAAYLLPSYEKEALKALNYVAQGKGIIAGSARTTIEEWQKGNLKNIRALYHP